MTRTLLLIMLLFIPGTTKSINLYFDGYIIHAKNYKEKCLIKVPVNIDNEINFLKLMNSVSVKMNDGNVVKYDADELKEFGFNFEGKNYKFMSFENSADLNIPGRDFTFMRLVEEGAINLFRFYYDESFQNFFTRGSVYYISKNSCGLVRVNEDADLINAVADDETIYSTLALTKFYLQDIAFLIKRYNIHNKPQTVGLPDIAEE